MPAETISLHATAVAVDGEALLILGPSHAGKSRLACALIGASTSDRPIVLIGDDRICVSRSGRRLVARPHPRIAGFIERRGLGIVAACHLAAAPVVALVLLGPADERLDTIGLENFPVLSLVEIEDEWSRRDAVLDWWSQQTAARAQQSLQKDDPIATPSPERLDW